MRICKACSARDMCLQVALDNNEKHDIWGGLTTKERRELAKQLANQAIAS